MSLSDTVQADAPAIPFVEVDRLDGEARALYEKIDAFIGFVPNSFKTYLHKPKIAQAVLDLCIAVYGEDEDSLPRAIQSKLGLICSSVNGCVYCTSHQCSQVQDFRAWGPAAQGLSLGLSDEEVAALISGKDEGSNPVERACFAFARASSFDSSSVSNKMLAELKAQLTPGQIVQLAAIVGSWKLLNTIHDSLHLPIEEEKQVYRHFFDDRRSGRMSLGNGVDT